MCTMSKSLLLLLLLLLGLWESCNCFSVINHSTLCLSHRSTKTQRLLVYPDGSTHSIGIPYASWASAKVAAEVSHILITEALGYSADLLDGLVNISGQAVNWVSGCLDPNDLSCARRDVDNPLIHFTVESWLNAISRASDLPQDVQPKLLSVLDYKTIDQWFRWQDTVDRAAKSPEHMALEYYKSFQSSYFKPHVFFDPWQKMLQLVPIDKIVPCSAMGPGTYEDRQTANYIKVTNDTGVECMHNDTVWFSPACRANTTECVPILLQYNYAASMQLAFFLDIPVAIVRMYDGTEEYDAAYYSAVRQGNFLFEYYQPDDELLDAAGRLPVMLALPPTNALDQSQLIFKTGNAFVQPRQYCWPQLPSVDKYVTFLVSQIDFFDVDMDNMMAQSRQLKNAGVDSVTAERQVACDWVRQHQHRWAGWIPAECNAGWHNDGSLKDCLPCAAGWFCPGGWEAPKPCPPGYFCPANTSALVACPPGRTTTSEGGASAGACGACLTSYVLLPASGACAPMGSVFLAIILPTGLLLVLLGLAAVRVRLAQEEKLWRIQRADITLVRPAVVLGHGCQGVVVKGYFRGTPVAVKSFEPFKRPPMRLADLPRRSVVGADHAIRALTGGASTDANMALTDAQLRRCVKGITGIRHPCITTVMGVADLVVDGSTRLCLVMELMEFGSLTDLLQNRMFDLTGETALRFLQNISQGMLFLHEARPPVLHGDLKSGNILIDRNLSAKISDFGYAVTYGSDGRVEGTTPYWSSPEVLNCLVCRSKESDVYSFGVIVYEVLTRRFPYENEDPRKVIEAIKKGQLRPPIPPRCSVQVAALMDESLLHDPAKRPSFAEIGRRLAALDKSFMTSDAYVQCNDPLAEALRRQRRNSARKVSRNQVCPEPPASVLVMEGLVRTESGTLLRAESAGNDTGALLRTMFPVHIAEALMRGERLAPEHKSIITMFFADIVGFTTLSSSMEADRVSDMLDRLFVQFDELADAHGVYKIETIGDAYLCATNVVAEQADSHAARMARFSQAAMAAAARTLIDEDNLALGFVQIRIGLHSGPCMASVVGVRNPKYTLLGDTINTASRMESHSVPGRIQCSAVTAELVRAQDPTIPLECRGRVEIKGKGTMETYWILVPGHSPAMGNPVPSHSPAIIED